jgi:hypothetical protein
MTGHGAKFGRKMDAAVAALLTQRNTEEAAKAAGVGYKTLLRWLHVPAFQTALRRAQQDAFRLTTARLQQAAPVAATMLLKVMMDPATPASTKVRAAESVLNHCEKALELQEIEARIAELERSADETKPGWRKT